MNQIKFASTGCSMAEMTTKNILRKLFSPRVGAGDVDKLIESGIGANTRNITVLTTKLRGYSDLAAQMDYEEIERLINGYYSIVINSVAPNNGSVVNFYGECLVCAFGDPFDDENKTVNAMNAAVRIAHEVEEANSGHGGINGQKINITAGIGTGDVLVGVFGNATRCTYSMIGETINNTQKIVDYGSVNSVCLDNTTKLKLVNDDLSALLGATRKKAAGICYFEINIKKLLEHWASE